MRMCTPIIERDNNDIALRQHSPIKERIGPGSSNKAPAMDPENNRPHVPWIDRRREDVQVKTILATAPRLHTSRCKCGGIQSVCVSSLSAGGLYGEVRPAGGNATGEAK